MTERFISELGNPNSEFYKLYEASHKSGINTGNTMAAGFTKQFCFTSSIYAEAAAFAAIKVGEEIFFNGVKGSIEFFKDLYNKADKLFNSAGGKGKIIEVTPKNKGQKLTLFENGGKTPPDFIYHQVYTDGKYIYDPRLSSKPVPKGDWESMIKKLNPSGVDIK
jgi:hypothetical protein